MFNFLFSFLGDKVYLIDKDGNVYKTRAKRDSWDTLYAYADPCNSGLEKPAYLLPEGKVEEHETIVGWKPR